MCKFCESSKAIKILEYNNSSVMEKDWLNNRIGNHVISRLYMRGSHLELTAYGRHITSREYDEELEDIIKPNFSKDTESSRFKMRFCPFCGRSLQSPAFRLLDEVNIELEKLEVMEKNLLSYVYILIWVLNDDPTCKITTDEERKLASELCEKYQPASLIEVLKNKNGYAKIELRIERPNLNRLYEKDYFSEKERIMNSPLLDIEKTCLQMQKRHGDLLKSECYRVTPDILRQMLSWRNQRHTKIMLM